MIIKQWLPLSTPVVYGSQGTYLTYGARTSSTLVAPSGIADGDLLIAYLFTAYGSAPIDPTPPAGWAALTGSPISGNDGSLFAKYHVFWKIASSEAGNYTFTYSLTNFSTCGLVVRYTGVDTSTPFSPTATTNSGTGATATATGFTTTNANTFVIFTEFDWADNVTNTTPPAGTTPVFAERQDDVLIYIADGTVVAAGATGDKAHTSNSTAGHPWGAYLIGLKPSAGAGGSDSVTVTAGALALAGKTVTVSDSITVTAGAVALAGKTVTVLDGQSIPVTASAIALTGKTVTVADSVAVSKATLALTGKTVTAVDGDVVVISTATLTITGKTVTLADSVAVAKATIALAGKTVTVLDGGVVVVSPATITLTGKTVTVSDTAGSDSISVTRATLTLSGGIVTVTDTGAGISTTPRAGYDDVGRVRRRKAKGLRKAEAALRRIKAEKEQEDNQRRIELEAQQRREAELEADLRRLQTEIPVTPAFLPEIARAQQVINAILREAQRPIPPEMQQRLAARLAAEQDEEEILLLLLD